MNDDYPYKKETDREQQKDMVNTVFHKRLAGLLSVTLEEVQRKRNIAFFKSENTGDEHSSGHVRNCIAFPIRKTTRFTYYAVMWRHFYASFESGVDIYHGIRIIKRPVYYGPLQLENDEFLHTAVTSSEFVGTSVLPVLGSKKGEFTVQIESRFEADKFMMEFLKLSHFL